MPSPERTVKCNRCFGAGCSYCESANSAPQAAPREPTTTADVQPPNSRLDEIEVRILGWTFTLTDLRWLLAQCRALSEERETLAKWNDELETLRDDLYSQLSSGASFRDAHILRLKGELAAFVDRHDEREQEVANIRSHNDAIVEENSQLTSQVAALSEENAKQAATIEELSTPDMFGLDGDNDTATPDLYDLANDMDGPGSIVEIWQNRSLGNAWLAIVPVKAEGFDDDYEPTVFATEEEARQAIAAARSASPLSGEPAP